MNIWCLQCRNLPLIFEQISEAALSVTYASPMSIVWCHRFIRNQKTVETFSLGDYLGDKINGSRKRKQKNVYAHIFVTSPKVNLFTSQQEHNDSPPIPHISIIFHQQKCKLFSIFVCLSHAFQWNVLESDYSGRLYE